MVVHVQNGFKVAVAIGELLAVSGFEFRVWNFCAWWGGEGSVVGPMVCHRV